MANSRLVLALAGVAISVYSIYVDKKFQEDENATAMCDIGTSASFMISLLYLNFSIVVDL